MLFKKLWNTTDTKIKQNFLGYLFSSIIKILQIKDILWVLWKITSITLLCMTRNLKKKQINWGQYLKTIFKKWVSKITYCPNLQILEYHIRIKKLYEPWIFKKVCHY